MPASDWKVNLLPQTDFEQSFWGKFVRWAVTSGRYVLIGTELIIILAFLSKFVLETQIANLNQKITGQKNILDSQAGLETEFKGLQSRVKAANMMLNMNSNAAQTLTAVTEKVPPEVKLQSISINGELVKITAGALGEDGVGLFLTRLSADKQWKSIELTQISNDKDKGLNFTVAIKR
jgi:hypothetical protein